MTTPGMNPFEQLRDTPPDANEPTGGPDARFTSRLRTQIEAALSPVVELPARRTTESETAMSNTETTANPATTTQVITPYISVSDGAAAIDWYTSALGAVETMRYTGDDGRVGHAEIQVSGARIYLSDAYPEIGVVAADSYEGSSCALHIEVADVDTLHAAAVEQGAVSQSDPADQPHGSRTATIVDPYGHRWMLNQTLSSPTPAEIDAATPGFTVESNAPAASAPARPIQLEYFTIHTDDVSTAAAFYSQLFGWNVDPESGHVDNCDLPFGFESGYSDRTNLWMGASDPDAVIAKVLELGGTVVSDNDYDSGRSVEFRDDQGNRFDIHEPQDSYDH